MILYLLAAVQFVNILDFMIVMPLGPDFARDLGMQASEIGWVGGSYTFAAFLAGLLGSLVLDRFDRKKVLVFSLLGLSLGTVLGGYATTLHFLLFSRCVAGMFGGPATAATLAIVSDLVPPEKRGRAMGLVMSSFAIASVVGVPAGLELARIGGWSLPLFAVGALGFVTTIVAAVLLPPIRKHLDTAKHAALAATTPVDQRFYREITKVPYRWTWALLSAAVFSSFLIIPNVSAFLQNNRGVPRDAMAILYFMGGICAFFSSRLGGIWADRRGALEPVALGSVVTVVTLLSGFAYPVLFIPVGVIFVGFMVGNNIRFVSFNTLTSQVPAPQFRARFMSMQSAVQHLMSSLAAFTSAALLTTGPKGELLGMTRVVWIGLCCVTAAPFLVAGLQRSLKHPR